VQAVALQGRYQMFKVAKCHPGFKREHGLKCGIFQASKGLEAVGCGSLISEHKTGIALPSSIDRRCSVTQFPQASTVGLASKRAHGSVSSILSRVRLTNNGLRFSERSTWI
jgi:hypothetical protein